MDLKHHGFFFVKQAHFHAVIYVKERDWNIRNIIKVWGYELESVDRLHSHSPGRFVRCNTPKVYGK